MLGALESKIESAPVVFSVAHQWRKTVCATAEIAHSKKHQRRKRATAASQWRSGSKLGGFLRAIGDPAQQPKTPKNGGEKRWLNDHAERSWMTD